MMQNVEAVCSEKEVLITVKKEHFGKNCIGFKNLNQQLFKTETTFTKYGSYKPNIPRNRKNA